MYKLIFFGAGRVFMFLIMFELYQYVLYVYIFQEDLSRRAYYARKKKEEQAVANQYHGLGVWCGVQIQGSL